MALEYFGFERALVLLKAGRRCSIDEKECKGFSVKAHNSIGAKDYLVGQQTLWLEGPSVSPFPFPAQGTREKWKPESRHLLSLKWYEVL